MALHMIKLCVGADTVEDLSDWQGKLIAGLTKKNKPPIPYHDTRWQADRSTG